MKYTAEQVAAEQHALSAQLMKIAKAGDVGFVLIMVTHDGYSSCSSNMNAEQKQWVLASELEGNRPSTSEYVHVEGGES